MNWLFFCIATALCPNVYYIFPILFRNMLPLKYKIHRTKIMFYNNFSIMPFLHYS